MIGGLVVHAIVAGGAIGIIGAGVARHRGLSWGRTIAILVILPLLAILLGLLLLAFGSL